MRPMQLRFQGTVTSRRDASPLLITPGDAVLVERSRPRLLVLRCPDGCGEDLTINVDREAGKAWRLYKVGESLTVFPSIWRDTGCESHFIISRGRIFLFGFRDDREDDDQLWSQIRGLTQGDVIFALSQTEFESVDVIADRIGALPWDVLAACRRL